MIGKILRLLGKNRELTEDYEQFTNGELSYIMSKTLKAIEGRLDDGRINNQLHRQIKEGEKYLPKDYYSPSDPVYAIRGFLEQYIKYYITMEDLGKIQTALSMKNRTHSMLKDAIWKIQMKITE